uniref:Zinc finger protein 512B n=1 Tax=Xiphophorus couchianus TaxID=32473 RepID=A0A3B5LJ85_9TELE
MCDDQADGKRKGRPKTDGQELRSIPVSISLGHKLSHGCPYCEAAFATKVRLEKHKLWNHPERVSKDAKEQQLLKIPVKSNIKKSHQADVLRVLMPTSVSAPSQNGELTHLKSERKVHSQIPASQQIHPSSHTVQSQSQSQSTSSDAGGSESEGGSLPSSYPDEDPERMRHRRKQKTPKKFTGEQPSISGTFGLKGMTKVEEKLKAGRVKRPEGCGFSDEPQRRPSSAQSSKKDLPASHLCSGGVSDTQWQRTISERGEVVCPTCSIVTRKTIHGLKKHMEICQKGCSAHFSSLMGYQYHQQRCGREFSDDERPVFLCQHCGKSYRSKAGRDYHIRTEHPPTITTERVSGSLRGLMKYCRKERKQSKEKAAQIKNQGEDFERTPSGRVRRQSAQVAVFHLQEIAEDELAKDWGTKRRIKDDLVPDSKRFFTFCHVTNTNLGKFYLDNKQKRTARATM